MLTEQLEELARKHGATSYRNRADTQHPAYGFTPAGLLNLLAEVVGEARKQDEALIRQMLDVLVIAEAGLADIGDADREPGDDLAWCEARAAQALREPREAIAAAKARMGVARGQPS